MKNYVREEVLYSVICFVITVKQGSQSPKWILYRYHANTISVCLVWGFVWHIETRHNPIPMLSLSLVLIQYGMAGAGGTYQYGEPCY